MKPSELKPLVGRDVWLRWNGERSGKVMAVRGTDLLSVQLLGPHGRRKIPIEDVLWVSYFGKQRTIAEYLAMRAKKETA